MHVKVITTKGVSRLYIYETYYDKDSATGKGRVRSKILESLGRLDELRKIYDNPVAHFKTVCEQRTAQNREIRKQSIHIDLDAKISAGEDNLKNIGYGILKALYKELELDKFWNWKTRNLSIDYSIDKIFRLLVFSRILYPGSKKKAYDMRNIFFEGFHGFCLDDVYYSLDVIARNQEALQKWIFDHSGKISEHDLSVAYFDCTNYYFDISRPDVDTLNDDGKPIDKNGIPMAYDLFPGNESEKVHMRPIINRLKKDYSNTRTIFVADRGLNTSDNIYWMNGSNKEDGNQRDGYVYGQSVRGADAEFKAWVIGEGYIIDKVKDDAGKEITFKHKSRIYPKELHVHVTKPGSKKTSKKTVRVDQKHVKNISFDKATGEILEEKVLELDEGKIREQELYDGYYSIVTSELNMSDFELRDIYRGLIHIEDTFKVSKSDFKSRPVYVSTSDHIDAHFSTCFTALVLIRLLQAKLGNKYPVGMILDSLRKYNCTKIDTGLYQLLYFDEILKDCGDTFKIELNNKYFLHILVFHIQI